LRVAPSKEIAAAHCGFAYLRCVRTRAARALHRLFQRPSVFGSLARSGHSDVIRPMRLPSWRFTMLFESFAGLLDPILDSRIPLRNAVLTNPTRLQVIAQINSQESYHAMPKRRDRATQLARIRAEQLGEDPTDALEWRQGHGHGRGGHGFEVSPRESACRKSVFCYRRRGRTGGGKAGLHLGRYGPSAG
jgi:hypothetical protein